MKGYVTLTFMIDSLLLYLLFLIDKALAPKISNSHQAIVFGITFISNNNHVQDLRPVSSLDRDVNPFGVFKDFVVRRHILTQPV